MIIIILCFFVACATLFYIKWRPVKQYWANLGVPHLPPNPFLGSLTFLLRKNPGVWMIELYEKFKTPYVGIWLFWRPAIIINCPKLARNILVKDAANFRNKFMQSGETDPIGSHSLLLVKDPTWTPLRKHLTSGFTSAKLKQVHSIARSKSQELIQRIENQDRQIEDLRTFFVDFTTDVFGIAAFGIASDATLTGKGPLRAITKGFMTFDVMRGLSWSSIFFWPELVDIFRFKFTPTAESDYLKQIIQKMLAYHKNQKETSDSKSLLDVLAEIRNKDIVDETVPIDDFITAQAVVLLIGGFDTSATTLSFALYELAAYQEEQDILYKELSQLKQKYGDDFTNYEHLPEFIHLDCVIKETLRLRPPMGWLDRKALEDYKVDDHLTIKAGTPVYVNANGMHMDPNYFPDPQKFSPDRFSPENERNIVPYSFLPFGEGPRMCIGMRFAQQTLKTAIATTLVKYKVVLGQNCTHPEKLKIDTKGLFYAPGEKISLEFIPREDE